MGVPMGTSRFFGCKMASPATVSRLWVRGIPVFSNFPMVDTVVTFSIMTPTLVCRAPGGVFDEYILRPLGIAEFQHTDGDPAVVPAQPAHQPDGLGLVVLDADLGTGNPQKIKTGMNPGEHCVAALQKLPVVRGQIRLALGSVDEQGVDLREVLGPHLHVCGEACAPQAHNAGVLQRPHKAIKIMNLRRPDVRIRGLGAIGRNDHHGVVSPAL